VRTVLKITAWVIFLIHTPIFAQNGISWQRSDPEGPGAVIVFTSNHAVNYETAGTSSKGNLEFQIYHRFFPPLSEGYEHLYGLDGPVNMRLGFGYALTDDIMITLGRSNVDDNLDLRGKWRFFQMPHDDYPVMMAVQGGIAWNTGLFNRDDTDGRNFQYYGQLILNTRILNNLALGAVPSYLYNSDIRSAEYLDLIALGAYAQYYFTSRLSTIFEFGTVLDGESKEYDTFAWGLELQTAGHFFKLFITNGLALNPSQYLAGSDYSLDSDEWRLGFMVTRLIPL